MRNKKGQFVKGSIGRFPNLETRKKMALASKKTLNGFKKGHICFLKHHTEKTKKKISLSHRGEKNYGWKGDDVGYMGLHNWLRRNLGNPKRCKHCGKIGKMSRSGRWNIDWAKKRGKAYNRKKENYFGLCRKCHKNYDL